MDDNAENLPDPTYIQVEVKHRVEEHVEIAVEAVGLSDVTSKVA